MCWHMEENLEGIAAFIFLNIKLLKKRPLHDFMVFLAVTQYSVTSVKSDDRN